MKYALIKASLMSGAVFLAACGDDDPQPTGGNNGNPSTPDTPAEETSTTFNLAVEVPEELADMVAMQENPLSSFFAAAIAADVTIEDLDLDNFEVRLYDPDSDGLDGKDDYEVVDSSELELTDLGNGEYELSVPGEPRLDSVIVTKLTITGAGTGGQVLELQVPTVRNSANNAEPLRLNYASTAATRQYINQAVQSGGFDEGLSVEEVDALIEEVAIQVASVPLGDIDLTDPEAVFVELDRAANDLVRAQIEFATAPEPVEGSLAARAGNYHGAIFGRTVFGQDSGKAYQEADFFYENYTLAPNESTGELEAALAGVPIQVSEAEKTADLVLGSYVENWFGTNHDNIASSSGLVHFENFDTEVSDDEDEPIPARIFGDGTLQVNLSGGIEGGFTDDDEAPNNFYTEIGTKIKFDLMPWGEAYVGSSLLRFDEYIVKTASSNCLAALGLLESDLEGLDEDGFDELMFTVADELANASAVVVSECQHNALGHEGMAFTFAKESNGLETADIEGSWGIIGMTAEHEFARGTFSGVWDIDNIGAIDEVWTAFYSFSSWEGSDLSISIEAEKETSFGTFSADSDGIFRIDWENTGDVDDTGYVSSDLGLMYIGGQTAEWADEFESEIDAETYMAFGVPLTSGVTTADLAGKTFKFVGLQMSFEGGLEAGAGEISSNHDSNAGLTISFSEDNGGLFGALGGTTDLGRLDYTYSNGGVVEYDVSIAMNDVVDGDLDFDVADNGALTVQMSIGEGDEAEDLYLSGFYDANGRIVLSMISGTAGFLAESLGALAEEGDSIAESTGNDFVNVGYMLGTCSAGCDD